MANSITLTKAFVVIDALDRTGKIFQAVTARTNLFARRMLSIGTRMATLMTVPAYAMKRLTDDFVRFEDKMLEVKAVTGITMAEFKRMSKVARDFGRSVTFSTQEVAEAMAELGRAGFNTNQIEHSMQGVLDLARSAQLTLKEASEFMGSTLQTFRIDMGDSAQVSRMVDIMTATANRSAVTVRDMVETMKMSGTIANTVGLSFEKYAEMIGALGNMGQRGSIAGTSIRRLLTQLATPRVEKELAKYGVHYYDQYGHIPDPGRAIAEYTQALKDAGLGASDIAGKLRSQFGLFGLAGIVAISKSYENGKFRFEELESSIKNCAGLAHQMAREMDSRLGGAMRLMIASIQECSIAVGEVLAPALSHTAGQVQNLFVWLSKWSSENASLARGIVGLGAMFFTAGISLTVLGTALYPITGLLGTVGGAFSGLVTTLSTVVPLLQIYLGQVATAFKGGWSYMRISDSNAVKRVVAHNERSKNVLALNRQFSSINDAETASRARMTQYFDNLFNNNQIARRIKIFSANVDFVSERRSLVRQTNDSFHDIYTKFRESDYKLRQKRNTALAQIDTDVLGQKNTAAIKAEERAEEIKKAQSSYLRDLIRQRRSDLDGLEGKHRSPVDKTSNAQSRFDRKKEGLKKRYFLRGQNFVNNTQKKLENIEKTKTNKQARAERWGESRRKATNKTLDVSHRRGLKGFIQQGENLRKKYEVASKRLKNEYNKLLNVIQREYEQEKKKILRDQKRADKAETRGRAAERREARTRYTRRESDIARNAKQQLQANAVWSSGRPTGKAGYFGRIWRELDSAGTAGSRGQSNAALHFMKRAKQQATLPFRKLFHSMKMANIAHFKSLEKEALDQLVNGMRMVMRQANLEGAGFVDSDFDKMREMILSGKVTDEVKQLEEYKYYSKPLQQVQKAQEAYTKTNAKSVSALKILRDSLARMPKNFSALWDSMKNGRIFIRMLANGIRGMGNVFKFVWGTIRSSWLSIIEIIVRVVYYGNLWKEALGALLVVMTAVGAGFWAFITAFDMMMRVVGKTVAWLIHAVNRLTSLIGLDFLGAFRGIADAVIGPVVRAFRNIANTVADTFHGVWKRIQIGDWKGAMEYAWTGIQIIWNELKIMFIDISANIRGFVENTDNLLVHLVKFFYQIGAGILDWVDGVGQTPETIQAQAKANYLNMSQEDRSKLKKEGVYNEKDYADYLYFKNARDLGLLFDRTTLIGQNKEYSDIARIQPNQGNAADIQTRKNEWGNNVSFRDIVVTPEGGFYFGDRLGEMTRSRREVDSVVLDKTTESYYTSEEETKRKNAQRSIEEARRKQESMDADLKAREEWTNGGRDRALEGFSRWIPDEDRKAEFQRLLGDFFRVKNINTAEAAQIAYDQIAGVGEVNYSDVISNMLRALPAETANKEIASLKSTISSLLDSWQKGDKAGLTKTGEFWDAHSLAEEGWETLELPALMDVIPGLKEAVANWQETAHEKGLGEAGSLDNVLFEFFQDQKKSWLEQDETYKNSKSGEIDRLTLNALGAIVKDMRKPERKDYYTRQLEANQKRLDELDKRIKTVGYREMDMVRAGSIEAERQKLEILSNQERQALYKEQEKLREENKRLEKERQQYIKSLDVTVKEISHKMPPLSQEAEERVVEIVENGGR